jgi:hypothetical protein
VILTKLKILYLSSQEVTQSVGTTPDVAKITSSNFPTQVVLLTIIVHLLAMWLIKS